ncbi:MAG TPA: non-canonical purine NTP pyrophosphatase, partial [Pirellulales bacterium]|nr:non-canonical purine NTP pyrophosphatase [Pirellulales bacterium]
MVLGTFNLKKRDELAVLLAPTGITVRTLADFDRVELVDETGDTFTANAELKASGYARALGHWVLADDSGLAVDALAGAPGVISAHFAGLGATDHDNNQLLLER